ncbi:L,D-transpeptidase family protein [Luteimonas sp. e5]
MNRLHPLFLALCVAGLAACNAPPPSTSTNDEPAVAAETTPMPGADAAAETGSAPPPGMVPAIYGPDGRELSPFNASQDTPAPAEAQAANDPATRTGPDGVLRAQVLLLRAHFSTGEIDGKEGMNVAKAVRAFQASRDLPETGELDDATWAELNKDQAPVLVSYTLTQADIDGPYAPTPERAEDKAKMERIVYQDIHEALGEKFNIKPDFLKQLNPQADFSRAGTTLLVPWVRPAQELPRAARIVVDKSEAALQLQDAEGKVFAQFPASTGSTKFPLPIGEWKITSLVHNPDYRYDPDILVGQPKDAKPATLPPGPNGPVGIVWMGINKEHYGIHGTPEPGQISRTQSSGCVRLTNWAAVAVASAVEIGLPVTFQE